MKFATISVMPRQIVFDIHDLISSKIIIIVDSINAEIPAISPEPPQK
jgi:hypothetical protein